MTLQSPQQPLAGMNVWLTRPAHQARDWADGLQAAGARVDIQPLLEIQPPSDEAAARQALAEAEHADVIVATSSNAVHWAWRLRPDFAPVGTLCAVGQATGQALGQAANRPVEMPGHGDTSEALLSMPALSDVVGQRIVLLSGEGGRTQLAQTLAERADRVTKAALYRRRPADIAPDRLAALINGNDAVVVTSGEAMNHLCALAYSCEDDALRAALARLIVVVPSLRVVQLTPEELFQRPPRVVEYMTVDAVVAALASGYRGRDNSHL